MDMDMDMDMDMGRVFTTSVSQVLHSALKISDW